MNITFKKATRRDAEKLAEVSKAAFHHDIHYGAPGIGGPPGYQSAEWQAKAMKWGEYYKILVEKQLVGGVIVIRIGPGHYEVGRVFITPEFQNQTVGTQTMAFLFQEYPMAHRWTLGTPEWNARTRHFYRKVGFVEVGFDRQGGVLFEWNRG